MLQTAVSLQCKNYEEADFVELVTLIRWHFTALHGQEPAFISTVSIDMMIQQMKVCHELSPARFTDLSNRISMTEGNPVARCFKCKIFKVSWPHLAIVQLTIINTLSTLKEPSLACKQVIIEAYVPLPSMSHIENALV